MRVLSCCRYLLGTWGGGQRRSPSEIIKRGPEGLRRPVACAYGLRRHASQPPGTGKPAGRRQPEAVWHAPAISVLFTGVLRARLTDISLGKHGSQDRWDRALMVREPLAARRGSEGVATRSGYLRRALATAGGPWHGFGGKGSLQSPSVPVGHVGASSLKDGPPDRRRLYGRLAATFFAGSGVVGLVTRVLPAPGSNRIVTTALYAVALALGIAIWFAPWEKWSGRASLAIVPPAFALIALGNSFRGPDLHTYGVFLVVAFVWIGMAHPPRTSAAMAPLAAAAYILPLFVLPGSIAAGLSSAAITIPVCVLVGEGIAWGVGRLEQIEMALLRERDRTEQLRELDEMKDRFLSAVSHELRTPITICRGHLEVLEDGAGEREVRAVKAMCVDELALMGRLVEDLATLARTDGRALLKLESLPLDSFLSSITAKAQTILGDRMRVEPGMGGAMLQADPQRLTQALVNLVQNAADHAKGDGPVCLRVQAEPSSWRFEVADDGGGLPPGDEQAVFEPFSTASSRGGMGLGLSIVRGIANAHGGESGVINRPGHGATFWIRIPR
jgi:signal transduction histidine kinase